MFFLILPGFRQVLHQHAKSIESFTVFCGWEIGIENACFLHVCRAIPGEQRETGVYYCTQLLKIILTVHSCKHAFSWNLQPRAGHGMYGPKVPTTGADTQTVCVFSFHFATPNPNIHFQHSYTTLHYQF